MRRIDDAAIATRWRFSEELNDRWTDSALDLAQSQADPIADDRVRKLTETDAATAFAFGPRGWRNGDPIPGGLPEDIVGFLDLSGRLPAWAEPAKLARAQLFFSRYPGDLLAMLLYAALPECFAAARGASVLSFSERMATRIRVRLIETAMFVVDVMSPGALAPSGSGVRSIQRTRWTHALVRRSLMQRSSATTMATPINQEEMAGTSLAFSVIAVEALSKLGLHIRRSDREAYLHAWNVVAFLLGVREEYLAQSIDEAEGAVEVLRARNHRASTQGQVLTAAVVQFAQARFPPPFRGFPAHLMSYLVPERTARALGLRNGRDPYASSLLDLVRFGFKVRENVFAAVRSARLLDLPNSLPVIRLLLRVEYRLAVARSRPGGWS